MLKSAAPKSPTAILEPSGAVDFTIIMSLVTDGDFVYKSKSKSVIVPLTEERSKCKYPLLILNVLPLNPVYSALIKTPF